MKAQQAAPVFLKPCTRFETAGSCRVSTILGSCVAVTFHHEQTGWSCIFHALLPTAGKDHEDLKDSEVWRFVDSSIHRVSAVIASRSIAREKVTVKLFGGAEMFNHEKSRGQSVGEQNHRRANDILTCLGYTITAIDVGGTCGRKIYFDTRHGDVWLKRLSRQSKHPFCEKVG